MNDSYDVIVVGARCAGAATARLLAAAGLDVLLVDRTRLPADTVSTHALMLGGVIQLRRWGLLDAVAATGATAIEAVDISAGEVSFSAAVKHIGGVERLYAPRRITLDALLSDAAVAAGAELRTGVTVTGLLRDSSGRVNGVTGFDGDAAPFAASAKWVVGADGARSSVARLIGVPAYRYTSPTNSFHYAYFSGLNANHYEFFFVPGLGAGAIPSDGGLTCIYASCPAHEYAAVRRDLDARFHRIVEVAAPSLGARMGNAERATGYRGFRGLPGYLRDPWGPGWVLVGDAGYHKDPFSVHGITDAFRDAELAARAIFETLITGRGEAGAMNAYHRARDHFAAPYFQSTNVLASYAWNTDALLAELRTMGEINESEAYFLAGMPQLWEPYADAAA